MRSLLATITCLALALPASAEKVKLTLGTMAPKDSSVHLILLHLREQLKSAPDGGLDLRLPPNLGGEADIVRRLRIGQYDVAVLTVTGLSMIDGSATALQNLPLMFRSLEEAAYVREKLRPAIEERLLAQGYVLLFLGDLGWVQYFSTKPLVHPDQLKASKMFTWTGDEKQVDLMKSLGLHPVPLEPTDVLVGLQTGLIDVVPMVPFFAQIAQIYEKANHMLRIDWAPLSGGGVVTKRAWDKMSPAQQSELRTAAARTGEAIIARNRIENDESIEAMKKRGLVVRELSEEERAQWRAFVEPIYPRLRGMDVPADLYDLVVTSLEEYRKRPEAGSEAPGKARGSDGQGGGGR